MAEENKTGQSGAEQSRAADSSAETIPQPPQPESTPPAEPAAIPPYAGVTAAAPGVPPEPSPALDPSIAATITVPPLEGADADGAEGGEWALLSGKLQDWLASGELQRIWQQSRTPLTALLAAVAVVLVLRIYASLLGALNGLPLVPGLLELVGVIWVLRKGLPKLLRSSERRELVAGLRQRWESFLGGG
jgi:hypothetical protein